MATRPEINKKTKQAYNRMLGLLTGMVGLAVIAAFGFTNLVEPTSAQGKSVVAVVAVSTITPATTTKSASTNNNSVNTRPAIGSNGGPNQSQGQGQRQGGFGGRGVNLSPDVLQSAANVLGISSRQLNSELATGKTLSQIAASSNVDVQKLKDAMLANIKAQIDAQVSSGRIVRRKPTPFTSVIQLPSIVFLIVRWAATPVHSSTRRF